MNSIMNRFCRVSSLICLIIFSVLNLNTLKGQSELFGQIIEQETGQPVISAQVLVYALTDSSLLGSTISDVTGTFSIMIKQYGDVRVEVSALFYQSQNEVLELKPGRTELYFHLPSKAMKLNEVAIVAKRPVKINNDTTVYDAAYFARGDEVVAEDLLRSIPGVAVSQDGKITIRGREVEKVMIDSDDFFEKGYRTVTKSLRASFIEAVEVLENYSNMSLLKGFEKSEKVAINLKLKAAARSRIFGDALAAGDVVRLERYMGQTNLVNLQGAQKFYALLSANNIGTPPLDAIGNLWNPTPITDNSLIEFEQGIQGLASLNGPQPGFRFNRTIDNQLEVASLSGIFHLGDKVKLRPLLSGFSEDQDIAMDRLDVFRFQGEDPVINRLKYANRNTLKQLIGRFDLYADLNDRQQVTARTSFALEDNHFLNQAVINDVSNTENLIVSRKAFSQRITYLEKLSAKTAWLLTGFGGLENRPERYEISDHQFHPILRSNAFDGALSQNAWNDKEFLYLESHFFFRGKEKREVGTEVIFGLKTEKYQLAQEVSSTSRDNPIFDHSVDGNALAGLKNRDFYLVAVHSGKIRKLEYKAKADVHYLMVEGSEELMTNERSATVFFLPAVRLKYNLGKKDYLELSTARRITNPGVTDLFPTVYVANNGMLRSGNENLSPMLSSQVILSHIHGHFSDRFSINSTLAYQYDHEYLSAQTALLGAFTHQRVLRLPGREIAQLSSSASQFFPGIRNSLRLNVGLARANYKDEIFGWPESRSITSISGTSGVELRSTFTGAFNYHMGISMNLSRFTGDAASTYQERRVFSDFSLKAGKRLRMNMIVESFQFSNDLSEPQQLWLIDGGGTFDLIPKKLTCTLKIRNLLNSGVFQTIDNSAVLTSQNDYRLLPRMILVGVKAIL